MKVARDVAIISFAQLPPVARDVGREEAELVQPVVTEAIARAGLTRADIRFTVSGSCDYLLGRPFSFVSALDGVAPWPPIAESHVEMDGAWALYEAWVRLQAGDIDTALVYAYGKSSLGDLPEVLTQQLDPYYLAPLGIDAHSLAALQARALLDRGRVSERDLAAVAAARRGGDPDALLAMPYVAAPLRAHDLPPISDGAAALILARGNRAKQLTDNPVWIRGLDHRMESHHLGLRDLASSPSTKAAGEHAGVHDGPVDVAELMVNFSHEEIILREALGLQDHPNVNPSGGPLCGHPVMATGLVRIIEVAKRIMAGEARRGVAHASSGPALQQNLVCVLEGGA